MKHFHGSGWDAGEKDKEGPAFFIICFIHPRLKIGDKKARKHIYMDEALQKVGWDAGTKSKEGPAIKAQRFTKVKREVSIAFCTVAGTRPFILLLHPYR